MGATDDFYTYHLEFSTLRAQIETLQRAFLVMSVSFSSATAPFGSSIAVLTLATNAGTLTEHLVMPTFDQGFLDQIFRDFYTIIWGNWQQD